MMKKMVFPVVLMILAGLVVAAVISCPSDKGPSVTTYKGDTKDGKEVIIEVRGDSYELKIDGESISTGRVTKDGNTLTLTTNGNEETVKVSVTGENKIDKIEGNITPDDGSDAITIDMLPPFKAVAGSWNWFTSDDSKVNGPDVPPANVTPQTIFSPGGASKITNAVPIEGEDGATPFIYPSGTINDNDGEAITVPVFNFTGNTKVHPEKPANICQFGAGWPLVGWEAQPADDETAALLKTAYGYTFWVKLNSSTANNWAFLTAVVTDFPLEKGYEYKHWFGNKPGDSGGTKVNNLTKDLKAGTWYQITVIMNPSGFNMEEDAWMHKWPKPIDGRKPFNQAAASRIQWQIPLQHNGGSQRGSAPSDPVPNDDDSDPNPYDIISGSYDFNLDFYGLELLVEQ
jgi:hypothetical protein